MNDKHRVLLTRSVYACISLVVYLEAHRWAVPNDSIRLRERQAMSQALRVCDNNPRRFRVLETGEHFVTYRPARAAVHNCNVMLLCFKEARNTRQRMQEGHQYDYLTFGLIDRVFECTEPAVRW